MGQKKCFFIYRVHDIQNDQLELIVAIGFEQYALGPELLFKMSKN